MVRHLNSQLRRTGNQHKPKQIHNRDDYGTEFAIKTNSQFYNGNPNDLTGHRGDAKIENEDVNEEEDSLPSQHRPYYRLPNKKVNTENLQPNYEAFQKLSKVLDERSKSVLDDLKNDVNAKELLYDMLVSEIKALCCNKYNEEIQPKSRPDSTTILSNGSHNNEKVSAPQPTKNILKIVQTEVMFVVVNDDITNSNVSDKVLYVDPDSLSSNSSIMILGQIKKHLTDNQLLSSVREK